MSGIFSSRRSKLHDDYIAVFDNPRGMAVLKHLANKFFVNSSTFVAGEPHMTSHNEGSRKVVLSILRFIGKDPAQLIDDMNRAEIEGE